MTWIIPAQLARVTGEGSWLGSSPRYVLDNGVLRHTGSFNEYRLLHPLAGARYLLGQQFAFIDAIGMKQRQDEQIELFVAMMARLQQFARDKFGAPLVVIYSWPDETDRPGHGESEFAQPMLVGVLARLRKLGIELVSVNQLTKTYDVSRLLIPHDGHPNALHQQADRGRAQAAPAAAMSASGPAGLVIDQLARAAEQAPQAPLLPERSGRALAASDQRPGLGAKRGGRLVADRPGLRAGRPRARRAGGRHAGARRSPARRAARRRAGRRGPEPGGIRRPRPLLDRCVGGRTPAAHRRPHAGAPRGERCLRHGDFATIAQAVGA